MSRLTHEDDLADYARAKAAYAEAESDLAVARAWLRDAERRINQHFEARKRAAEEMLRARRSA